MTSNAPPAPSGRHGIPGAPEHDWKEDFSHENGQYQCRCVDCSALFYGHKRRSVCRVCAAPLSERRGTQDQRASAGTAEPRKDGDLAEHSARTPLSAQSEAHPPASATPRTDAFQLFTNYGSPEWSGQLLKSHEAIERELAVAEKQCMDTENLLNKAESALAEAQSDAERYRWLEDNFVHAYCKGTNDYWRIAGESKTLSFDHQDLASAIDAAIRAAKEGEK